MRKPLVLLTISLLLLLIALPHATGAQQTNHAALLIEYSDGDVETFCVAFEQPQINGYELLQQSGVALEAFFTGANAAICRIDETGCPASNCFCQCSGGGDCAFWGYWHWRDEEWTFSNIGAPMNEVHDGALEAWVWGSGRDHPPPDSSFAAICEAGAPANTATATNSPTATIEPTRIVIATEQPLPTQAASIPSPSPTATETPVDEGTVVNTVIATPTITPVATSTATPVLRAPTALPTAEDSDNGPVAQTENGVATATPVESMAATLAVREMTTPAVDAGADNALSASFTPEGSTDVLPEQEGMAGNEVVMPSATEERGAFASQRSTAVVAEQAAGTATPQPEVTVIGAVAAVPQEGVSGDTGMPAGQPSAVNSWLPYSVFVLICLGLASLLLLGRRRGRLPE